MHLDRQADLTRWIPLGNCADLPARLVGRKAQVLAEIGADDIATPGGLVLPSTVFWEMLEGCGAAARARYLAEAALRLDPDHVLGIAATIADSLAAAPLESIAAPLAADLFDRVGADRLVCRSSAAMEDGRDAAFPGMFTSVLGIRSADALAQAIAACWRSVFQPNLLRYLLRMRPARIDFSLALLVQPQLAAQWYGLCFSEDPLGTGGMVAQLSDAAPDALVDGAPARHRFTRADDIWHGDAAPPPGLERIAEIAARLADRTGAPVDIEFALPGETRDPVILQCRPATRPPSGFIAMMPADVRAHLRGTGCAPGRRTGRAAAGDIALVPRVTTQDYALVLASRAIVAAADTSPLGHVAILCRELGIPLVAGVGEAIETLAVQPLLVDGGSGDVFVLAGDPANELPTMLPPAEPDAVIGTTELLLRMLAVTEPGDDPAAVARDVLAAYARGLGATHTRITAGCDLPDSNAAGLFSGTPPTDLTGWLQQFADRG